MHALPTRSSAARNLYPVPCQPRFAIFFTEWYNVLQPELSFYYIFIMEQDPVEQTYISQGTPEVTTDTDSDKEMENCGPEKSNIDRWASLERIREETRIVVLDYLGSLPADRLTARNFTNSENRAPYLKRAIIGLSKSASDAGAYESKRKKFLEMAKLQRKLSLNLKRDIETFDHNKLRGRAEKKM